ncbi:MAG TPA: hypothetical protein VGH28_25575 [Polyangiaceae bacterium]|jgi:hypothetical protein
MTCPSRRVIVGAFVAFVALVSCGPRVADHCEPGADSYDGGPVSALAIQSVAACTGTDTTLGGPGDDCQTSADCIQFCCACPGAAAQAMVSWCQSDGTCADANQTCCAFAVTPSSACK